MYRTAARRSRRWISHQNGVPARYAAVWAWVSQSSYVWTASVAGRRSSKVWTLASRLYPRLISIVTSFRSRRPCFPVATVSPEWPFVFFPFFARLVARPPD
jgi:hypothetical protein